MSREQELEQELAILLRNKDTLEDKICALKSAYWVTMNTPYSSLMENREDAGCDDKETVHWAWCNQHRFEIHELLEIYLDK